MSNILPEPTDTMPIVSQVDPEANRPKPTYRLNRQTMWVLIALVVIAFICLLVAFIYDYSHNRDQDNTQKQDITYISNYLNSYYDLNHYYPTLNELNSNTFGAFAPNLDRAKFKDPVGSSDKMTAVPTDDSYAYEVSPLSCNNITVRCTSYKLVATLSDNSNYIVSNPKAKN